MMNRQSKQHWPEKIFLWGGLTLLFVVLTQGGAVAQTASDVGVRAEPPEAFEVLQLVCVFIGIFAGSLLAVESRWQTFFLGLGGIIAIGSVITAIGFYSSAFPDVRPLIASTLTGLALGIILVGAWWWGHRQGYTHALYMALLSPDKYDRELFQRWVSQREKSGNRQLDNEKLTNEESEIDEFKEDEFERQPPEEEGSERRPTFWQSIYFRAAAVRYRRLMRRPEIEGLYHLIVDDVLKDAEEQRKQQLRKNKEQKLIALLEDVEGQYTFTKPIPPIPPGSPATVSTHK